MEQKNNFPVCLVLNSQAASFCLRSGGWLVNPSITAVSTPGVAYRRSGYVSTHWRCRVEYSFYGDVVGCVFDSILHGKKSSNTGRINTEPSAHLC